MFCSKDKKSIYKSQIFEQFSQTRQTLKCWKKTSILPGKEFNQLLFALTRLDFFQAPQTKFTGVWVPSTEPYAAV